MKALEEIYNKHKIGDWPDKGSVHSYIEVYEEILAPYRRATAFNILEIGLMSGESLRMWDEYFSGNVYGMDCDIRPVGGMADLTKAISEGYKIMIGDAANPHDIEKYFKGMKFDVVIEDAGHAVSQQYEIYQALKPYLNKGYLYIIEDIQDICLLTEVFDRVFDEKEVTLIDRRNIKGRYDDIIITIKDRE
jgi:hypothetical protein